MKTVILTPLLFISLLFGCKKGENKTPKPDDQQTVDGGSAAKFVKLYAGNFALKSDGSLWGWGGVTGHSNGYTTPREILKGGVKDFQDGFVVKDDGTLYHMGIINLTTYMAATCGPWKVQFPTPKPVNHNSFTQVASDANWVKVGVKNNGYIYNVVETPTFQYSYWDKDNCKGWWRDLNYRGTFMQITDKFNDWKYTSVDGGIGLRNNGTLYLIASLGFYPYPTYKETTYPDILMPVDYNVSEILDHIGGLILYKKSDETIWYRSDYSTQPAVQVPGNWKSITIAAGALRFIGVKSDGTLWAWGYNKDGFLGDGTYIDRINPVKISDKNNWLQVSVGLTEVFYTALDTDGNIYGWGKNDKGQLGDGTLLDKYKPTLVIKSQSN